MRLWKRSHDRPAPDTDVYKRQAFGLRAKAKNFSHEDMAEGIAFAHEHGVKVYVTVNILAHNGDLPGVREYLQELRELKPDLR